jgi:photosystem II stability/assembly factor-like uncharacterized protein
MIVQKLRYILFLSLLISNISAQSIFEYQNPYYIPESLNNIQFVSQTGWVVGNAGLILKTSNGGLNFVQQSAFSKANFKKVFVLDSITSYVLDDSSSIFKTINGGNNWALISAFNTHLNDMHFINQNTGFITSEFQIGITTNGGSNWSFVSPDNSYPYNFYEISFINSQTGYVSALNRTTNYTYMFKTTNGGINWSWYNTTIDAFEIYNIHFNNSQTGWCAGSRLEYLYAMKTINGGVNWTESLSLNNSSKPNNVYFSDNNTGYITTPLKVFKSTNGGANWLTIITGSAFQSSYFINSSSFYLADNYSRIFKTTNSGNTFDTLLGKQNSLLLKIQSIDANKLWSNGINYANWKSTNGGTNWLFDNSATSLSIKYTEFTDVNTGFAIAGRGTLFKTSNFGVTWNHLFDHSSEVLSLHFLNSQTGWAFADNSIFKTTNNGLNWTTLSNPNGINKAKFFEEQNGYGYNSSYLYKTTNSGVNWNQASVEIIQDYSFINNQTGWTISVVDTITILRKTTNGGLNWTQYSTINDYINNIKYINENIGYLLSYDKLYRTTNGGNVWKFIPISKSLRIFSMDIIDANTGWLCGDNSLIIKLINGGAIFVNSDEETNPNFQLFQNYPNPFNSSTNIRFTINKQSYTSLIVYDIQGREVAVLVNKSLSPNSYTIKFDYANLPSGIYFYTLTTDSKSITKKLLLLK